MTTNFQSMSFADIIASTQNLVRAERELIAELIRHLIVIEARKIYALEGYSSLYAYCTEGLGLSHNKACKRVAAAKVARLFPSLLNRLENGELSVSILALLVPKLTEANFDVILKGIEGRSKREAELFLSTVSLDGEIKPDAPKVEVRILCPQTVYEKLERAKDILAPEGQTWADVLDHALEAFLDKHDPLRKAERAQKRAEAAARGKVEVQTEVVETADLIPAEEVPFEAEAVLPGETFRSRYISQDIRHAVYLRDGGRCTYVSPEGHRCLAKRFLEFDHRLPLAFGGEHCLENLRLLCRTHNSFYAGKMMGDDFIRNKVLQARGDAQT